ncbi:NAD/NADP octopine/nopaline dehydrogenase family protein [Ottowia sp.]|uniref:NAD/NADP octopine/nopaline dehydrogenase family protein n=1 Tax=Ottowia sp. TaxID=1898956 RepID=UPI0034558959
MSRSSSLHCWSPGNWWFFNPEVLGSSLELARHFALAQRRPCLIAETATSLSTCRLRGPAKVFIGAIKQAVPLATIPHAACQEALARLSPYFGNRYVDGTDTLSVGLGNCNAIYHVPPAVLNIKTVEDSAKLPQHTLVTPRIAEVINALDEERLSLAGSPWREDTQLLGVPRHGLRCHRRQPCGADRSRLRAPGLPQNPTR